VARLKRRGVGRVFDRCERYLDGIGLYRFRTLGNVEIERVRVSSRGCDLFQAGNQRSARLVAADSFGKSTDERVSGRSAALYR